MQKLSCAIIGSGNIGMNLLYKIEKSKVLDCSILIGRNPDSENLSLAKNKGYFTSAESNEALIKYEGMYDLVFDATTAENHKIISGLLEKMNKFSVDLTPAKVGKMCVPVINGKDCINENEVNMVTCGGQAMVPIAVAIKRSCKSVSYLELVATISSASAGIGTRSNIDEFIETTQQALAEFTGVQKTKTMMVLNPAEPPIVMRNTLYAVSDEINIESVIKAVSDMEAKIQNYVPGYKIVVRPTLINDNTLSVTAQVEGTGDFMPRYAGNLDIITCAGIEIAEMYAYDIRERGGIPF